MKRISLDELEQRLHPENYQKLYEAILQMIDREEIKLVKAA